MSVPEDVISVLKEIKDPETGGPVIDMVKDLRVEGKKVSMKFVPPFIGCAFCGLIGSMMDEIREALEKKGYEVEIELGFPEET